MKSLLKSIFENTSWVVVKKAYLHQHTPQRAAESEQSSEPGNTWLAGYTMHFWGSLHHKHVLFDTQESHVVLDLHSEEHNKIYDLQHLYLLVSATWLHTGWK